MAAVGHFGCLKFTLDHISGHFRSIQNFFSGGHFGCLKITFDLISGHFRSIRNFNFFLKFLTKWLPSAILDVRNSLWITFLAILDKYRFLFFLQNGCRWQFWMSKKTFDLISIHFISICNFNFFLKKWQRWPFWMSEFHFRSHFCPFQIDTQL